MATCSLCADIGDMTVNTGRDEYFPDEVDRLVRLSIGTMWDLRQCPECESYFEWEDLPQYYGSGNNAEERLERMNAEQEGVIRELLDSSPGPRDGEDLFVRASKVLSDGLLHEVLDYVATKYKAAFADLLEPVLSRLILQNDGRLYAEVMSYCGKDRERLSQVARRLDQAPELKHSASYLRNMIGQELER